MDEPINPIFADQGRTRQLISTAQPARQSKPRAANPKTAKIVAELGFRFRPTAQADLEAHAERLRLLTMDLIDVPVDWLEKAANKWALEHKWMPTAAELTELARGFVTASAKAYRMDGESLAQRANWRIMHEPDDPLKEKMRRDVHWVGDGAGMLAFGAPTNDDCFPDRVFKGRWQ